MIDHEALGELEDWNHGWRTAFPDLSSVYVPGEGDNPRVMIVGEAPGAQEEVFKRPFVGPAGRVLRELMAGVELFTGDTPHFGEPNCWLTNVVHFRPARNRTPTADEITVAREGLSAEWLAVGRPKIIVPVGGTALAAIMGRKMSILKMAGKRIEKDGRIGHKIHIWPMIHPSFGLREKSMIPLIEKDWDRFNDWLIQTAVLT